MVNWEAFYSSFREPDYIPGYEILERLGGGAFGEVYRARKTSIGKSYAIKFLKVDDDRSSEIIERELSHARLFAAIDHPNLVAIEDLGQVSGVPFVVMGYAGEDTLARRLSRGGLDAVRAFEFFVQVCRGVLALHERSLVHFDLKPSNVFLRGDVARVGDYGLAKLLADGRQTLSIGRGTPHYMAPEILKGRADQRADIYSLGVILFEIFAGRTPYDGESGLAALLRDEELELEFPDGFPERLRGVVERCLAPDPASRPGSVGALLDELGQTGRAGEAVPLPFDEDAQLVERGSTLGGVASQGSGPPTPIDDVVEWEALGEGGSDEAPAATAQSESATEHPHFEAQPLDPELAGSRPSFAGGAGLAAGGIPVPPRFDGGPLSAIGALGALAFEMFLALLHGPVRATVGYGSRGVGSVLRGVFGMVRWVLISFALGGAVGGLLLLVFFA
ncbi:MAG: serine/threonine-protein kinase [Planctomycetota bacterium]